MSTRPREGMRRELPKDLHPRERELLQWTLQNYPDLTVEKAIEMLKAFGGL